MNLLKHLFIEDEDGRISHTRFWSSVAYAVATWVVIKMTLAGTLNWELFTTYLAVVASHTAASKWLTARFTKTEPDRGGYGYGRPRQMSYGEADGIPGSRKTPGAYE